MARKNKFYPNIIHMSPFWLRSLNECQVGLRDGRCAPARALGWGGLLNRLKAARLVWTGRADALVWPQDQEDVSAWPVRAPKAMPDNSRSRFTIPLETKGE